jgi:predicted transcriptional regulator
MGQAKRQRTAASAAREVAEIVHDNVQNATEQANFEKLVRTGVIVQERDSKCQNKQKQT